MFGVKAHLAEEEILSRATGFAADEVLRLPPRLPGQGLHRSLIDAARDQDEAARRAEAREAKKRAREAAAAAAAAGDSEGGGDTPDVAAGGGAASRSSTSGGGGSKPANSHPSTGGSAAAGVGGNSGGTDGENEDDEEDGEDGSPESGGGEVSAATIAAYGNETWLETPEEALERVGGAGSGGVPEWDRVPTAREEGRAHDVVVTGPPLSGKSTLSRALGVRHRLPTLTVDGAVKEVLRLRSKLGARVRAAIHWFTAKEEVCA